MKKLSFPDRKISEAFLEFSAPLLDPLGKAATKDEMEQALQIAFTVWNSVVYDAANGSNQYVAQVRKLTADDQTVAALVEQLIRRKQLLFADDQRLVGKYEFIWKNGGWILRVEARSPSIKA